MDQGVIKDREMQLKHVQLKGEVTKLNATIAELQLEMSEGSKKMNEKEADLEIIKADLRNSEKLRSSLEVELQAIQDKIKAQVDDDKDDQIAKGKAEIARLLTVVQKECQERTELLIQISMLKEQPSVGGHKSSMMTDSKSGSTAYSHALTGGLNHEIIANTADSAPLITEKRLVDAIAYSKQIVSTDPASIPQGEDEVWRKRVGNHSGPAGRGGKRPMRGNRR